MLAPSTCVTLAIALLAIGCGQEHLSPQEEKIIGTWEFMGLDEPGRIVFRRDHTMEDLYMRPGDGWFAKLRPWATGARGKWSLDDDTIVVDAEVVMPPPAGETSWPRRKRRTRILEFHPDKLVRDEGRSPLTRVR